MDQKSIGFCSFMIYLNPNIFFKTNIKLIY